MSSRVVVKYTAKPSSQNHGKRALVPDAFRWSRSVGVLVDHHDRSPRRRAGPQKAASLGDVATSHETRTDALLMLLTWAAREIQLFVAE